MGAHIPLQESMDRYVQAGQSGSGDAGACMEALAYYLLHYSDMYQDQEPEEVAEMAEWEEPLEQQMIGFLEGDTDPVPDLGATALEMLDAEHIRDFIGWFILRETCDARVIESYAESLRSWFDFIREQGWWSDEEYLLFCSMIEEVVPQAVRAAKAASVLFHFVRQGGGVPSHLRGKAFSRFCEGHARLVDIRDGSLWFRFDNHDSNIGPVILPEVIREKLAVGDVFDVELGLRDDTWLIVDVGPIYPDCVYVEAEEYQDPHKIS